MFGYKEFLVYWEDEKYVYHFPNGYGASVVSNAITFGGMHGLWEVKLFYGFDEEVKDAFGMPFLFGYNLPSEVKQLLEQIKNIPAHWNPHDKKTALRLLDYFRR